MPISPGTNPNNQGPTDNTAPTIPTPPTTTPIYAPKGLQTNIGNTTPPQNQTLVYSPDVRILISHAGMQYEVSNDLVRGTVIRKENSASSLLFTCHNKGLRYTNGAYNKPLFSRMDRVTCYMKRAGTWIQVFSGYLDSIPYLQLYPGLVNFKATCTLKRLLCNWWNPGLQDSAAILNQYNDLTSGAAGDGQISKDSGMGSMLHDLLVKVGGWTDDTIHIQNFPNSFMDLLEAQLKEQGQNQAQVDAFRQLIEGDVSTPAPGAMASYNTAAGSPGAYGTGGMAGGAGAPGATVTGNKMFYVQEIVAACDTLGLGPSVVDTNVSSGTQQAAQTGEQAQDPAVQKAFQQLQQTAKTYNTSTKGADAAILGVACAIQESTLLMYANYADPDSLNYPHDAVGKDGTSVGLFQQINQGWGSVSERMNARQSAMMFFTRLSQYQWQNQDPGQAVWNVQRAANASTYAAGVDSHISEATQLVNQVRGQKSGSTTSTGLASPATLSPGGVTNILTGSGQAKNPPTTTPQTPGTSRAGKPSPDSEGAINWAMTQLGKPYIYGSAGPDTWDCSSLLQAAFKSIGLDIGRDTYTQATKGVRVPASNIGRGDAAQYEGGGHTTLWCGDGTLIEAATEGVPIHRVPAYFTPAQSSGIFHYCDNGGVDGTAPFNPPATVGPGNPPYTGGQTSASGASGQTAEPIAQNLFAFMFTGQFATATSMMYGTATPQKDYIDAQPLIQMVQSVCGQSLRHFASAPNGDFIAYYPDFFGMDLKPAVFILEDIELKDLTMSFSDDALATHVYVNGAFTEQGQQQQIAGWLATLGYATVENQNLYQRMRLVAPGDLEDMTGQQLMQRFGVRPIQVTYSSIYSGALEFLCAVSLFMEKWAAQYQSACSMTFMPDLFPGMRVQLANHNLQFYVNEVTHTFDFEQGFTTEAVLTAPSNPNVRNLWNTANQSTSVVSPTAPVAPLATISGALSV